MVPRSASLFSQSPSLNYKHAAHELTVDETIALISLVLILAAFNVCECIATSQEPCSFTSLVLVWVLFCSKKRCLIVSLQATIAGYNLSTDA